MVGQAAFEKEMISLENVPDDYMPVSSSVGDIVPKTIVVSPFIKENEVIGVVELGSIREFSQDEIEFIKSSMENIAVAVNSGLARMKMKDLFERSRDQAEELQKQQEELRITNEELEQQTNELKASQEELKQQQEELRVTNEELEEKTRYLESQKIEIEKKNEDLKKASIEIEKKAKDLASASKYKSEFLANMSHELRTPLNSLLILAQDLAENNKGNLEEEQVESAEIIYQSGNALLNLINDVLDLSKVEAGKMTLDFQTVHLRDISKNIKTNFKHQADQKNLELKINMDKNLPETIHTDGQRVEQIIKNLLSNSLKFTSKGGITVNFYRPDNTTVLSHSGLTPEKSIAISVTDTGIGIPKEKQQAIFEAFQQADGETARKFGGTGLGLSISKELLKLLGGELQLESKEDEGSTFTIYLPEFQEGKTDSIKEKEASESISGKKEYVSQGLSIEDDRENIGQNDRTILLIEDDVNFAKIVYKFCQQKDFKFIHAGDGENGLMLAEEYKPDAIILDRRLPGMDGMAVLTNLKQNPDLRHIPVQVMSVKDGANIAYEKGAIGYLKKPVNKKQLENAFSKLESFYAKHIKELLIVEDDENMRKVVADMMGNGDVKVTAVATGKSALNELKARDFDCMILDLKLPDFSGLELLKKVEHANEVEIPPVIVYTGKDLSKEEESELKKYAKSIIIKGAQSKERLLDETTLFLHQVVEKLPAEKQKIISSIHDKDELFKDKKILLVDDDVRNIFAVAKVLEKREVNVFKAPNGKEALKILQNESDIDLILMDIMMPVMDGYETMKKIREQKQFSDLPIIAFTAKAMKDDREKCIAAGANDYIAKPLDVPKLLSLMRVWLYNR